jgi:hypothetical protein
MVLGSRASAADTTAKGAGATREAADTFAANVPPVAWRLQAAGAPRFRAIAQALNDRGVRTACDGEWHDSTVRNLLARA